MSSFITDRIGRLLFAVPFGIFGIIHFLNADNLIGAVPSFIPGGAVWVYMTGIALLGASYAIVSQTRVYAVSLLLSSMILIFALTVHLPGVLDGHPTALPNLLKDLSLAGGALLLAGMYQELDDGTADSETL